MCRVVLNEHAAGRARAWEQRSYLCLVLCSGELSQRARLRFRRNPVLAKLGTARRTLPLCPQGNFQVSRDLLASDTPVCRSASPVIDLRSWLPNGRRRKIGKSAGNGIDCLVEYYQTKDALHYYLLRHMGLNNRAENSHVPPRKRERMMHGFRSAGGFQRFISVFSAIRNISSRLTRNAQPLAPIVIASAHWKVVTGATA